MSQSLTSKTVQGIKWSTASTIANAAIQPGYAATMARLLDPSIYGLASMSDVVIRFGAYFAQMGMMQALIQKVEITNEDIRAAFTSYVVLGLLFVGLFWVAAPFAATTLFDNQELVPYIRASSFNLLLAGLGSTAASLLRRNLDFKTVAKVETTSYILGFVVVGLTCALLDFGAWSIIFAALSQNLVNAILFNWYVRHDTRLLFTWKHYKPLFVYGSQTSIISFIEYICANMDTLLIGRLLGKFKLGIYNRAFYLVYLPTYQLTHSLSKVVFSSYSKLQSDLEKLGKAYLSSIVLIAAMVLPISLGILAASREMVLVLLGDKWTQSIPVLSILCLAIPFNVISTIPATVCSATANLKSKLILKLIYVSLLVGLFYMLKRCDLLGFATAVAIGESIQTLMYMLLMQKILKLSFWSLLKVYLPGLMNGVLVALAIYLVTMLMHSINSPLIITFICQIIAGGAMQLLMIFFLPHPILKVEIQKLVSRIDVSKVNNKFLNRYLNSYVNFIGARA